MRLDKPSVVALVSLVLLAIALALLLPWQCARGQSTGTAGQITITIDYSAQQDVALSEHYGTDWKSTIRQQWREAFRNRVQEAREAYKQRRASLFDDDLAQYLTDQERKQIARNYDSAVVRKKLDEALKAAEAAKLALPGSP